MSSKSDSRSAGFTMIELVIATMMLILLSYLVSSMIISGNNAQMFNSRLDRVADVAQEVTDDIQGELRAAVRIFSNDARGNAFKTVLQPWSGVDRISTSTLPTIDVAGIFEKDTTTAVKTGNELLFARHAWADTFTCTSGNKYRIDVYRMVAYFMKTEGTGPVRTNPWGLNLCKWTSEPLVDGGQIDEITDLVDQAEFLVHLKTGTPDDAGDTHDKLEVVWTLDEDPAAVGTFRQITGGGALSDTPSAPRSVTWELQRADDRSSAGLLYYTRRYSVASNFAQRNTGVARYGILDNDAGGGTGFPHGFEVQIVGNKSARKVMLHMTFVSTNMSGLKAYYDSQATTTVREG